MKHITQLHVLFAGEPVGILAWRNRQYWFQYDAHWLQHGFDLSPETISFTVEPQLAKLPIFQGLLGIFHDSLPDGWGLLLMDRFFKSQFNWDYHEITPLDRLAYLGQRAMGALEYEPTIAIEEIDNAVDLMALAEDAERVLAGKTNVVLNQLRILGGSPGGARPKVTVGLAQNSDECVAGLKTLPSGFSHWLVKFRSEQDPKDMGRIEMAYGEMANAAGLNMPPSRLISLKHQQRREDYFAVQRFDRQGNEKRHMLTLSGYIYADHRVPSIDYHALLSATSILTKNINEVKRAFRLMLFNIVMHNKDDHAKNFAFLHDRQGDWRLAPGYDLTFSRGMNNAHTTAINGKGNPTRKDIQAIAMAHSIKDWEDMLDEVLNINIKWEYYAKKYRVTAQSKNVISNALNQIRQRFRSDDEYCNALTSK
jgi:serine/threonine-protein kinase HipA